MARHPADFRTIERDRPRGRVSRRGFLIGGGTAAGLAIAWGIWPRSYKPNLTVARNELAFNAFLKIDTSGQVIVVVPQLEMGQGVTTVLPQLLADELGADWRTVAVQTAPVSPLYANSLLVQQWLDEDWLHLVGSVGQWGLREYATRNAMMLTGGASALPMFERAFRDAGAAARVLLCKAAAARWDVAWESCDIIAGIVSDGRNRARIGELAGDAVNFALPEYLPERQGNEGRLVGESVPRLDLPSKLDGSHTYAADIRLPEMLFASVRQGPVGAVALRSVREAEARKVPGFVRIERTEDWVAVLGSNWWAANRALDALDPVFDVAGPPVSTATIDKALEQAFEGEAGRRIYENGDLAPLFDRATILKANYSVAPALHLAVEPPCATARVRDGKAEIWCASQAPTFCRAAVARALAMAETDVTIYPVSAGGSFDRRFEHDVAVQAAILSQRAQRPVQLLWSRLEETIQDRPRPPAKARMAARLARGGMIAGWSAKVAAPSTRRETWDRIARGTDPAEAMRAAAQEASRHAVAGMELPYVVPNVAIDHYPANIGVPTGGWRGGANSYGGFFTECFIDELAGLARIEPMSFRIQMLGGHPRLAHCLTTVTALGGWQGGVAGSGQGIACHAMDGGYIAVLAEVSFEGGRLAARKIIAAVDCGNQPHPDIAMQQIEGGLVFGLAAAMGCAADYRRNMPARAIMGRMGLPRLTDVGEVTVELIESSAPATGPEQLGVPAIAPALANALFTLTGRRHRHLPLVGSGLA